MATTTVSVSGGQLVKPNFEEAASYLCANTTFYSENAPSQPQFDWVEISSTSTDRIGDLSTDNVIRPLPLGFTFQLLGGAHRILVSSNGWIAFVDPVGEDKSYNSRIPDADLPNGLVAWF